MTKTLPPEWLMPTVPVNWDTQADLAAWNWSDVAALPPFTLADGSGPAKQQTTARICADTQALYLRFDCADHDIWGTYSHRDAPIYDEEVVELFIGPGETDPIHYYEFEISPNGVLLDAKVYNPTSQRAELEVNIQWDCPGIRWQAHRDDEANHWWAVLVVPWAAIASPGKLPQVWRANFFRIERPRNAVPEFSCWSPTMTNPADFHKPTWFGKLKLAEV